MIATAKKKAAASQPLGQVLVGKGLLLPQQLESALSEQRRLGHRKLLGEILVELNCCTDENVAEAVAESCGIPFARISPRLADPKVVGLLPREFVEKNGILPLFLVQGTLTVAAAEPADVMMIEEVERLTGHRVQVVAATSRDLRTTLDAYLPDEKAFVVRDLPSEADGQLSLNYPAAPRASAVADPAAVKLLDSVLYHAIKDGATDVHLEPGPEQLRIRCRIDGRLVERQRSPRRLTAAIADRLTQLAGIELSADKPVEANIDLEFGERTLRLRASFVPGHYGPSIVLRLGADARTPMRLEKLGFAYDTLKLWRKLIAQPSGLILVTGPAGSGKKATLYATLMQRASDELNIASVEETIDQALPGVNQFQARPSAGFSYSQALAALAAQDVDVLMIGDLAERQAMAQAAQTAQAGRLVLGAMVVPDAVAAIARMGHLGIEPYVIGSTLAGILNQRLVRKLCPSCKISAEPAAAERRQLDRIGGASVIYHPKGCDECRQIGYAGRIALHELWQIDDAAAERLSTGLSLPALRDLLRASGMKSLRSDGLEKVKAGITSLEEVHRATPAL
ncbi:MAG TPA: ATPase, T2SS/T4P/T4SS family [Tepidisphaeraceae bacterium]|nr:ATPase, T2SS/T4P/T4SS family [Tepidisphaeraceae bacterium]